MASASDLLASLSRAQVRQAHSVLELEGRCSMRIDGLLARLLGSDPRPVAGLDLGPTGLRWALLDRQAGHWRLQLRQWPVSPDWLEDGRLIDYPAVTELVSQAVAQAQVRQVAMTLPAEACHCLWLQQPSGVWRWRQRTWLSRQALKASWSEHSVWAAHRVEQPVPGWRLLWASIETIEDWQGLAEAAKCQLVCLEDAHQASWRALDQWHQPVEPGVCLFQVGARCVQALEERSGRWHWAWRLQDPDLDLSDRCLEFAAGRPGVFLMGEGDEADRIRLGLERSGHRPREPDPPADLVLDGDFTVAAWPALGLAGLRGWT